MNHQPYSQMPDWAVQQMDSSKERNREFLKAWKDAVQVIGEQYFQGDVKTAKSKDDLAPLYGIYSRRLGTCSSGERFFMLAVYQFYNDSEFADQRPSLADLAYSLNPEHHDILFRLLKNYQGW